MPEQHHTSMSSSQNMDESELTCAHTSQLPQSEEHASYKRRIAWISTIDPTLTLDVATWIETSAILKHLGWDVTLIAEGPYGEVKRGETTIVCVPRSKHYFVGQASYYFKAFDYIAESIPDVDVILFHQMAFPWIYGPRLRRIFSRRKLPYFVMDTRDLIDVVPGDWKAYLYRTYSTISHRLAPTFVDGQTAITPRLAEMVGIKQEKLLGFWPSGVRLESFCAASSVREWPKANDSIRLIYVGIFLEKRHLVELAHAVVAANQAGMRFQLLLFGDGPMRPALQTIAEKSDGRIVLNQPVPHQQIPELLARAHVGVTSLPALDDRKYQASSPIKLFEYLAAGMPVLATRNVCHTDVVGTGRYAFWADTPSSEALLIALGQLWENHAFLSMLGAEAADAATAWSWEAAAEKLNDALLRLCEDDKVFLP